MNPKNQLKIDQARVAATLLLLDALQEATEPHTGGYILRKGKKATQKTGAYFASKCVRGKAIKRRPPTHKQIGRNSGPSTVRPADRVHAYTILRMELVKLLINTLKND